MLPSSCAAASLRVVTARTQRLPVVTVPEECCVASVRYHVVNGLCWCSAFCAVGVLCEVMRPRFVPGCVVKASGILTVSAALAGMCLAFSTRNKFSTARMRAGFQGLTRHQYHPPCTTARASHSAASSPAQSHQIRSSWIMAPGPPRWRGPPAPTLLFLPSHRPQLPPPPHPAAA